MKELLEYVKEQAKTNFNHNEPIDYNFKGTVSRCIERYFADNVDLYLDRVAGKKVSLSCSEYEGNTSTYIRGNEFTVQVYMPVSGYYDRLTLGRLKYKVKKEIIPSSEHYWARNKGSVLTDIEFYVDGELFTGTIADFVVIANEKIKKEYELLVDSVNDKISKTKEIASKLHEAFPEIKSVYELQTLIKSLDSATANAILGQ